jgi:hypothetical protein
MPDRAVINALLALKSSGYFLADALIEAACLAVES